MKQSRSTSSNQRPEAAGTEHIETSAQTAAASRIYFGGAYRARSTANQPLCEFVKPQTTTQQGPEAALPGAYRDARGTEYTIDI